MIRRLWALIGFLVIVAGIAEAQWITVTVDISGGRWQVASDATISIFNRLGNIAGDGYIGGTHSLYTTNANSFKYPYGFGKIYSDLTNTAALGSPLPAGCNYASIDGQDYDQEDAFLWMDLNDDGYVEEHELFGSRMPAPSGGVHRNGFQALEKYDHSELGGDGDGTITKSDAIWKSLQLWVDRNHDGSSDKSEIGKLDRHHIVSLPLSRKPVGMRHSRNDPPGEGANACIDSYRGVGGNDALRSIWLGRDVYRSRLGGRAPG